METTAENLVNFINKPVMIQDGLKRHLGVVLSVTEREDGLLDIPLHFDDEMGFHKVAVLEIAKNHHVMLMEEEGDNVL